MIKFSHSVFALPFALMATFLASRSAFLAERAAHPYPSLLQLSLIVLCMVAARSVAMSFNRLVDHDIDRHNPRTRERALPAGTLTRTAVWGFLLAATTIFLSSCAAFWFWLNNRLPLLLAVPMLAYLCFYSYTKRFTRWSHYVLGSAIAFAPVGAWLAIDPDSLGWPTVVLMAAVTLWIAGFDIIYACQDVEFDRQAHLFSLPASLGISTALWLARLSHLATVGLLLALMSLVPLGWLYLSAVAMVAALLFVENALVRPHDLSKVNLAFFTLNGLVSLLLGGMTLLDILFLSPTG